MKKIVISTLLVLLFATALYSQESIDKLLLEIEKNNTTLLALRKNAEADKLANKTGIYLQNPVVGFNYLWGSPEQLGNRTDLNITQSIDFPTAYGHRRHISDIMNVQVDIEYEQQLKSIMMQARMKCYDLVYTNALIRELEKRFVHAEKVAMSYKRKFEIGETNILEYNKAQLSLLNLRTEMETLNIERTTFLSELTTLNGGVFIDFLESEFLLPMIPVDFEAWYAGAITKHPTLGWLQQEAEKSQREEKLNRSLSLPKFAAGYMSERVLGTKLQGLTVGVSIPLWENKNTVKYARAYSMALESADSDNRQKIYNRYKTLHAKAIGLQKNIEEYRSNLELYDNASLLETALDKGEINLIDYILGLSIFYESITNLLELERDMNKTAAELNQYM